MNDRGVILIANNNSSMDYVKQAWFLAKRINRYLKLPVSIITDSIDYLTRNFDVSVFDEIIEIDYFTTNNNRIYFDGGLSHKSLMFKNNARSFAYFKSPYNETILMDTDFIVSNDTLLNCFEHDADLMLYKNSHDLSNVRDTFEFKYLNDKGIDFYWATVIYFKKSEKNEKFFSLVSHIEENWDHYRRMYYIQTPMFRNDYAFSIAVHIMNNFSKNKDLVQEIPGCLYYISDRDLLWELKDNNMLFLVEKKNHVGEYTILSTTDLSVHVMNKFSLERIIDQYE